MLPYKTDVVPGIVDYDTLPEEVPVLLRGDKKSLTLASLI